MFDKIFSKQWKYILISFVTTSRRHPRNVNPKKCFFLIISLLVLSLNEIKSCDNHFLSIAEDERRTENILLLPIMFFSIFFFSVQFIDIEWTISVHRRCHATFSFAFECERFFYSYLENYIAHSIRLFDLSSHNSSNHRNPIRNEITSQAKMYVCKYNYFVEQFCCDGNEHILSSKW